MQETSNICLMKPSWGWTALILAANKGHKERFNSLINLGANIEAKDK